MLRRGIFFSHREMNRILMIMKKETNSFYILKRTISSHILDTVPWVFAKWAKKNLMWIWPINRWWKFFQNKIHFRRYKKICTWKCTRFHCFRFRSKENKNHYQYKKYPNSISNCAQVAKKLIFQIQKFTFGFTNETIWEWYFIHHCNQRLVLLKINQYWFH